MSSSHLPILAFKATVRVLRYIWFSVQVGMGGGYMKAIITMWVCATFVMLVPELHAEEKEVIAVIGTGDMGNSLGPKFAKLGYRVVYGSRKPASEKVIALVAKTGNGASAATQIDAAQMADIIVLALPWPAMETVAKNLGQLDGKIIVDISLPWRQGDDGYPETTLPSSAGELIQDWNPRAKVVKTLATAGSNLIDDPLYAGGLVTMPLASNHRDAKETVAKIVAALGFDPVDFGPLRMSRQIESLQLVWLIPVVQRRATGWEIYFRRSHWPCEWILDDWTVPTADAGQLAEIPEAHVAPEPCP